MKTKRMKKTIKVKSGILYELDNGFLMVTNYVPIKKEKKSKKSRRRGENKLMETKPLTKSKKTETCPFCGRKYKIPKHRSHSKRLDIHVETKHTDKLKEWSDIKCHKMAENISELAPITYVIGIAIAEAVQRARQKEKDKLKKEETEHGIDTNK